MNAVEKLEAAIDRLSSLHQYSLIKPPITVHEGPEWYELRDADAAQVAPYMNGYDAELLATLHRTVSAQIAILRAEAVSIALHYSAMVNAAGGLDLEPGPFYNQPEKAALHTERQRHYVLALADAILGGGPNE